MIGPGNDKGAFVTVQTPAETSLKRKIPLGSAGLGSVVKEGGGFERMGWLDSLRITFMFVISSREPYMRVVQEGTQARRQSSGFKSGRASWGVKGALKFAQ